MGVMKLRHCDFKFVFWWEFHCSSFFSQFNSLLMYKLFAGYHQWHACLIDEDGICLIYNGHVERAQRTHTEEFYELTDSNFDMVEINVALREWEFVYDTVRPHQSLGYLTPYQFLQQYHHNRKEVMCH